jgi:hypothetical protein
MFLSLDVVMMTALQRVARVVRARRMKSGSRYQHTSPRHGVQTTDLVLVVNASLHRLID